MSIVFFFTVAKLRKLGEMAKFILTFQKRPQKPLLEISELQA